jgi:hypothetical protein
VFRPWFAQSRGQIHQPGADDLAARVEGFVCFPICGRIADGSDFSIRDE